MSSRISGGSRRLNYRHDEEGHAARKPDRRKRKKDKRVTTHQKKIKISLEVIKSATSDIGPLINSKALVNEQDLFAAMIHKRLTAMDPELGGKFRKYFQRAVKQVEGRGKSEPIFRSARRAMRKLVNTDELVKTGIARRIRRFAAGKAKIDDNKMLVLATKLNEADPTPTRTMKESLSLVKDNSRLTDDEYMDFKNNMNALLDGTYRFAEEHECKEGRSVEEDKRCDMSYWHSSEEAAGTVDGYDCIGVVQTLESDAIRELEATESCSHAIEREADTTILSGTEVKPGGCDPESTKAAKDSN